MKKTVTVERTCHELVPNRDTHENEEARPVAIIPPDHVRATYVVQWTTRPYGPTEEIAWRHEERFHSLQRAKKLAAELCAEFNSGTCSCPRWTGHVRLILASECQPIQFTDRFTCTICGARATTSTRKWVPGRCEPRVLPALPAGWRSCTMGDDYCPKH